MTLSLHRLSRTALLAIGALALVTVPLGCDIGGASDNEVTISGRVLDASSNPVEGAGVIYRYTDENGEEESLTTETDSLGRFSGAISVEAPTEVEITASKKGAIETAVRQVSPDIEGVDDVEITLGTEGTSDPEPGRPTDILLVSRSREAIRVQESGGTSTAAFTFQVVDSTGTPIDIEQSVEVDFRFGQQPGDATLTPETVRTNGSGQATVNVSSGKTSGVVQLVGRTQGPEGQELTSKPVTLTIHGGLPNKCHFSVGAEQTNFAGLTSIGLPNTIGVIVGDKYGNPVVPGTSVYFSTNAGVIGGSTETGTDGQGSVTLTSAQPLPNEGVGAVLAETVGREDANTIVDPDNCTDPAETGNENKLRKETPIVFSGRPEVVLDPSFAKLDTTYQMTIQDVENGNPLAPGTTINVSAEGTKVKAVGNTDVTLDDTGVIDENGDGFGGEDVLKGEGITSFTFRVVEDQEIDEGGEPTIETVTVTLAGPNGDLEIVLTPRSNGSSSSQKAGVPLEARSPTNGATVQQAPTGKVVVQAPKQHR